MALEQKMFSIDDDMIGPIRGWDTGQTWNGFAMPLFDYDAAIQILAASLLPGKPPSPYDPHYDPLVDAFVFFWNVTDEPIQWEFYYGRPLSADDPTIVYPIGAGVWVWDAWPLPLKETK